MLLKRSQFSNVKWFDFGIALHLHYDTLKTIEANYPRDINSCLRECLVKWLERADDVDKNGGANWATLIQALEESEQKTPAEHISKSVLWASYSVVLVTVKIQILACY